MAEYTADATVSYAYDPNGLRASKTVDGVATSYYYNGSLLMAQQTGDDVLLYTYDAAGALLSVNFNGTEYFYLRNGQGDVTGFMDNTGVRVVSYVYDVWGRLLSTGGTLASTLGAQNPFRYRGYYYDAETGFYYIQSRYYDPAVCRFVSADVLFSTGQGVLGHNMFAYCLNSPVGMKDDDGEDAVALPSIFDGPVWAWPAIAYALVSTFAGAAPWILLGSIVISIPFVMTGSTAQGIYDDTTASENSSDPYARAGQKKQGRERKAKARKSKKWIQKSAPKPLKKHTPGKAHQRYK